MAPATENVTRDDIQYADDESQPRRNGWFWLRYDQRGPGAQAEIARDLSPEAHGDGSLRLVTRTTDDQVAVRRLTAAPGDPRLPLADIASGSFDVLLSSGAAPSFVIGEGVVSRAAESTLRGQGVTTVRIGGTDRYATAVAVARAIDALRPAGTAQQVFLASGTDFPDALSAGAPAGAASGAVLLTRGPRMAPATAAYLAGRSSTTVYAVGGDAARAVTLPAGNEIVGANRYETATLVADRFFPEPATAAFASGATYPDALSAAAFGGHAGAPVLMMARAALPDVVAGYVRRHRDTLRGSVLLGGTGAVDDATFTELAAALTPPR